MTNFEDKVLKQDEELIEEFSKLLEKGVMPKNIDPESDTPITAYDLLREYLETGKKPEYVEKFYNLE